MSIDNGFKEYAKKNIFEFILYFVSLHLILHPIAFNLYGHLTNNFFDHRAFWAWHAIVPLFIFMSCGVLFHSFNTPRYIPPIKNGLMMSGRWEIFEMVCMLSLVILFLAQLLNAFNYEPHSSVSIWITWLSVSWLVRNYYNRLHRDAHTYTFEFSEDASERAKDYTNAKDWAADHVKVTSP